MQTKHINLEQENKEFKHNFHIELQKTEETQIIIDNASKSRFKKGWENYKPFISKNNKTWIQAKEGKFNGETFSFIIPKGYKYACCYPPYSVEDLENFLKSIKESDVKFEKFANIHCLTIGDKSKPNVTLTARMHPGESMGSFFIEGAIEEILKDKSILDKFYFTIIPMCNVSGVKANNHRLTSTGFDMSRQWKRFPADKQNLILKNIIPTDNPFLFLDVHGDEVSKMNYIFYNKMKKMSEEQYKTLFSDFTYLKDTPVLRRFIKNLIRHRILVSLKRPATAKNFYNKTGYDAFLLELSAHITLPKHSKELGERFIKRLNKTNPSN